MESSDPFTSDAKNIGIAGFLMKKTIQPFSLRKSKNENSQLFQNTNPNLYIHKKIAEIRNRIGANKLPPKIFYNPCLKVKEQKKTFFEMKQEAYEKIEVEYKNETEEKNEGNGSPNKNEHLKFKVKKSISEHKRDNYGNLGSLISKNFSDEMLTKLMLNYKKKILESRRKEIDWETEKIIFQKICGKLNIDFSKVLDLNIGIKNIKIYNIKTIRKFNLYVNMTAYMEIVFLFENKNSSTL